MVPLACKKYARTQHQYQVVIRELLVWMAVREKGAAAGAAWLWKRKALQQVLQRERKAIANSLTCRRCCINGLAAIQLLFATGSGCMQVAAAS